MERFKECRDFVYKGEADQDTQERCLYLYSESLKDVKEWLRSTMCEAMAELHLLEDKAILYLPLENLTVEAKVTVDLVVREKEPWGYSKPLSFDRGTPGYYTSPIGIFDYYTYSQIVKGGNPVSDLYLHLFSLYTDLRELAGTEELLSSDLLRKKGIQDVLGLHRIAGILEAFASKK